MRAFAGQRSDNVPVQRDPAAKRAQLKELKERLRHMRAHESPALRTAIETNIAKIEAELAALRR